MITYSGEVSIKAPAEQVFRCFTDPRLLDQFTAMQNSRVLNGNKLEQLGAHLETEINEGPMKAKLVFEVDAIEPGRHISFKSISQGPLQWNGEYWIEPQGAGASRLRQRGEIRFRGFMRLLEPLMRGEVQKGEQREIEKLRDLLESGQI
ncbi:MAG TPA: SRPBCC family protein [Anaerolineales bacterium]|nr:SRPBCC family protein [Anaerolineales bacterium]